jgi:hypothetical protein
MPGCVGVGVVTPLPVLVVVLVTDDVIVGLVVEDDMLDDVVELGGSPAASTQ